MRVHASITLPAAETARLEAALRADLAADGQLAWEHPNHWRLALARFGSVVQSDAYRLGDLLTERVEAIPAPRLQVVGITALPEDGDDGVWADLGGDLDAVADLAAQIPRWVLESGFVPDRRAYRSRIRLARITPQTTADYLESLIGRVGGYRGERWTPEGVTLAHAGSGSADRAPELHVVSVACFAHEPGRHAAVEDAAASH